MWPLCATSISAKSIPVVSGIVTFSRATFSARICCAHGPLLSAAVGFVGDFAKSPLRRLREIAMRSDSGKRDHPASTASCIFQTALVRQPGENPLLALLYSDCRVTLASRDCTLGIYAFSLSPSLCLPPSLFRLAA